ncbi:MAG TPA: BA14K family protein [Afifellaceae bacterium]|nr:BA14K family protein [Afifellaceae bacterium]
MARLIVKCGALAAAAWMAGTAPPAQSAELGRASTGAIAVPVQFRDGGSSASHGSLFERPTLDRPGSLFRPRSYRLGPHYQPPSVVYQPPPVVYQPPSLRDRASSLGDRSFGVRCVQRTRPWYDSCAARFRSFDPNRGTYTTFSGQERPCRCP